MSAGCTLYLLDLEMGFQKPDKDRENGLKTLTCVPKTLVGSRNRRNEVILNCTHNLCFRAKILDTRSLVHSHHCGGSNENP